MKYGFAFAVGDKAESSRGLPSLATVADLFLPMCGRNLDCLKPDLSDLPTVFFSPSWMPLPSLDSVLMRKKFFIRCETWLLDICLFEDSGTPVKARFSEPEAGIVEWLEAELNNCVMVMKNAL